MQQNEACLVYCSTKSATEGTYQNDPNKKIDVEIESFWMACGLVKQKQMKPRVLRVSLVKTQL